MLTAGSVPRHRPSTLPTPERRRSAPPHTTKRHRSFRRAHQPSRAKNLSEHSHHTAVPQLTPAAGNRHLSAPNRATSPRAASPDRRCAPPAPHEAPAASSPPPPTARPAPPPRSPPRPGPHKRKLMASGAERPEGKRRRSRRSRAPQLSRDPARAAASSGGGPSVRYKGAGGAGGGASPQVPPWLLRCARSAPSAGSRCAPPAAAACTLARTGRARPRGRRCRRRARREAGPQRPRRALQADEIPLPPCVAGLRQRVCPGGARLGVLAVRVRCGAVSVPREPRA